MQRLRLLLLLASATIGFNVAGKTFSDHLYDRQLIKQSQRWSLSSAFFGKPKGRLTGQILSSNPGASLFEFGIFGSGGAGELRVDLERIRDGQATSYGGLIYFWTLGIEGQVKKLGQHQISELKAHLRLVGDSDQNSHFSVFFGKAERKETFVADDQFSNNYLGAKLQVYLTNQFGASAEIKDLLKKTQDVSTSISGREVSYELFFEYGAFRIFARRVQATLKQNSLSILDRKFSLTSDEYGLKFYF